MTIRFAAAADHRNSIARHFGTAIPGTPANDGAATKESNVLLRAALLHFSDHGLGAAEMARDSAEQAFFDGDRKAYTHWLSICRLLDARMAKAVEARRRGSGTSERREA